MIEREVPTFWVRIYTSGPQNVIEQVCREECFGEGLCVTVDPTRFIYTGGEETGCVIGLIAYPRFPTTDEAIAERAKVLANKIMAKTFQHSVLLMTPTATKWISLRE